MQDMSILGPKIEEKQRMRATRHFSPFPPHFPHCQGQAIMRNICSLSLLRAVLSELNKHTHKKTPASLSENSDFSKERERINGVMSLSSECPPDGLVLNSQRRRRRAAEDEKLQREEVVRIPHGHPDNPSDTSSRSPYPYPYLFHPKSQGEQAYYV